MIGDTYDVAMAKVLGDKFARYVALLPRRIARLPNIWTTDDVINITYKPVR